MQPYQTWLLIPESLQLYRSIILFCKILILNFIVILEIVNYYLECIS